VSGAPRVFQFEPADAARARELARKNDPSVAEAVGVIRGDAEKALKGGPYTVTQKKHPLPGIDPHDYVSLAPYYWPDPKKADGLPYINRDGHRNPEIREYDAEPFGAMSSHVYNLALGYYFTGEEKYAERAAILLRTWFVEPATRMNPNLDHAQIVKGHDQGRPTGIIESLRFLGVIDGVGLLHGSKAWTEQDQKAMEAWFGGYQRWMIESKNGKGEDNAKNNHGTWYDVQVVTFALFLNDQNTARRVCEAAKTRRIATQIEPDGSMPLEIRRANSFHYSIYNVRAMTQLSDLTKRVDVDLWHFQTADHRGVRTAVDFLMPFA
jgi:Alginate lyase